MDIGAWLRDLGLERYADAFRANEIDRQILPTLTAEDLSDIGVKIVGHRRKILNAAALLEHDPSKEPSDVPAEERNAPKMSSGMATEAERRHLTLMFVDLVGSTALSSKLDPEEMRQLMRSYQNAIAGEVTRFRGHVAKFLGDGVLAYFGFPQAHEDDAERSVRAALSIIDVLTGVDTPQGIPLRARIGIATGLVVVGDLIGDGPAQEPAVIGETPNLAARLQALAGPGQILISAATRQLLGNLFEFDDFGVKSVKGIDEPIQVYLVQGEQVIESRFAASHAGRLGKMAGRDQELALLIDRWRQAKNGDGQIVLLIGEAGIGKSRITQALIDEITVDRPIRLYYQCSPHHRDSALYPAIRQLRHAADLKSADEPTQKLEKLEALLRRATDDISESAPLIADLLSIHDESRYGKIDLSSQKQRMRTLQVLVDQLMGLASQYPVLLIVEDAHWIDPTTLELIELSIDAIAKAPVLILMTTRPDDQVQLRGHPNFTSLSLNRLPQEHVMTIVKQLLGGMTVPQDMLDEIVKKTDGVPLFVEEVAKAVVEEGLLSAHVPASLHDSLMARLDRIPEARQVAQTAAAIGREFDFKLLRDISSTEETELSSALGQLVEAEIIFCRGIPPEASYSFKHALVRDAAYESLLREKRRSLHGQIADALSDDPTGFGRTEAMLAYHQALAERHEDAIRTWIAAADRASGQSAYQEALGLVDTAVDHLPNIQDKELRSELEISVELARADVRQILDGPTETAIAAYTRVRDLARKAGDHRQEFIGAWGLWFNDQQRNNLPSAAKRATELIHLADLADDSNCVLQANHANWTTAFYSGDLISTKKYAQQGYERYDPTSHYPALLRFGSHDAGCCARYHLAKSNCLLGFPETGASFFEEGVELARRLEHPGSLVVALVIQVIIQQMTGDVDAVENSGNEFGALADRHGMARFAPVSRIMLGWVDACRNEGQSAIDKMKSGIESLESTGGLMRLTYYKGLLADALWRIDNVEAALATVDDGIEFVKATGEGWYLPELHRLKGAMLLQTTEMDEGVRQLKIALDLARKRSARWFELRTTTSLAGHLADMGEGREAKELLEPICSWFTEGRDTPDLRNAKALLQMLQ
ncbi:MAG: ATP-binding protein [Geminicoccaceae bacterium]